MQSRTPRWGRWVVAILAICGLGFVFTNMFVDNMPKGEVQKVEGYMPWEDETVDLIAEIPLQDGGRIKPFSTYAGFKMLSLHGARSMKVAGDDGTEYKIEPTQWLMDTVFRPKLAEMLPTFRVDNSNVLEAIGIEPKGRRDRYSYNEIAPGIDKLVNLAKSYESIKKDDRDPVQQQSIDLAYNIRNYESLLRYFTFARSGLRLTGSGGGTQPDQSADFSAVMASAPQLRNEIAKSQQEGTQIDGRLENLLQQVLNGANYSKFSLNFLPPTDAESLKWSTLGDAIMGVMTAQASDPATAIGDVKRMETMVKGLETSEAEFRNAGKLYLDEINKRAGARGELRHIGKEIAYFRANYFLNALVLFLIGSLCALAMWGFGESRLGKGFYWATLGFTTLATILSIIAIVKRCLIMERPPVGNLYDTVIFIGTTGVVFALIIEWMTRKRFALGLAPILGTALLILARRYELGDASDHMDPLVAVLDSNFWLATHVITISLGYSAGLLAAMLSCGYLLMRGLRLDGQNQDLRKSLTKAVYGCICLTVFLSLVGTVLGGIWANYSWGRFWGWDPKENGALMIVLWTLAILHARLGGLIRDWGLHLASVFTACIVAFSWWHVNFLGVGLHNYGFTAGKGTIWIFYAVMMLFLLFGFLAMFLEKAEKSRKSEETTQQNARGLEA